MQKSVVVHLIHGTWGRGLSLHLFEGLRGYWLTRLICKWVKLPGNSNIVWTDSNSRFRIGVNRFLKRFEPSLVSQCEFKTFEWSGSNSFRARQLAATEFRDYWRREIAENPTAKHLIVAHSHGGMVAVEALSEEQKSTSKLAAPAGLLTMATPFLSMEAEVANDLSIIGFETLPRWLLGFHVVLWSTLLVGDYHNLASWIAAVSLDLLIALFLVPRLFKTKRTTPLIIARIVGELLYFGLAFAAAWFALSGIISTIPIVHPAASYFAAIEIYGRFILATTAALVTFGFLVLARAANAHHTESDEMILRDTVLATVVLLSTVLVSSVSFWAFVSTDPVINTLAAVLLLLPLGVLFLGGDRSSNQSTPGRRILSVSRLAATNKKIPMLTYPLRSLRLAGDEATLAIASSQLVKGAISALASLITSVSKIKRLSVSGWLLVAGLFAASLMAGYSVAIAENLAETWAVVAVAVVAGLYGGAMLIFMATLTTIGLLILGYFLSASIMALAVGPEVVTLVPLVRVDCESLPRCANPEMCQLVIEWRMPKNGKHIGLRHALYDLRSIQCRVAQWIISHAAVTF
jgi:hypothetical protein